MRLRTLALAAALAVAGPALAKRVNITGYSPASLDVRITFAPAPADAMGRAYGSRWLNYIPDDGTYDVESGQLAGFLDGASFLTYCAEVLAPIEFGTPNVPGPNYDAQPAPPTFGAQRTADLSRLFTAAYDPGGDAGYAASFQLAVWEIIYEQPGPAGTFPSYDMTDGSFSAEGVDDSAFGEINDILANLGSYEQKYNVELLVNPVLQDLLLVTQVPEPGTYALLAAGLGVIGFLARRRRSEGR